MSDAFDEIKNINGYTTNTHSEEKIEKPNCYIEPEGNIIKNFVIKWGRKIIDILAWLGVIFAILLFVASIIGYFICIYNAKQYYYYDNNYIPICTAFLFLSLLLPLIILIVTIMTNYFLYLIIDIRDSLKELTKK